jgi:hypothetical protein
MTSRCVDEETLLRLIDGELTENEAERLRQHVGVCGVCAARSRALETTLRELRAPVLDVDPEAAIEQMMRRIPAAVATSENPPPRARIGGARLLMVAIGAALALSALVVAPRVLRAPGDDSEAFRARGAPAPPSIARAVGVSVYRAGSKDALAPDTHVSPNHAYVIKYRNLLREPAYLLAFAVDANGTVHWVCPAYLDATSNPAAVQLTPSTTEVAIPSAMQLEGPAPGAMRFVAILTRTPLHVLDVDKLRGAELSAAALRVRWTAADVRELVTVQVDSSR